jgi:hypothetical protein
MGRYGIFLCPYLSLLWDVILLTHVYVRTVSHLKCLKANLPENLKCDKDILQGFPSIDSAMSLRISIQLTLHHYDAYYRYPLGAHFQFLVRLVKKVQVSQKINDFKVLLIIVCT